MAKIKMYYNLDNFFDEFYGPLFGVDLKKIIGMYFFGENGSVYSDAISLDEVKPIMSIIYNKDEEIPVKTKVKGKFKGKVTD